ncbi:ABC transporter permease [Acetobacter sp. DsW_059]|uniref:ABC transporter permease n=1 Tax=Acetobacter sp. DsW_059 TaxID=1670661 RepID=UPI000A3A9230|nr:ABC transporter permease [Acetobacter sp. DsW_059]
MDKISYLTNSKDNRGIYKNNKEKFSYFVLLILSLFIMIISKVLTPSINIYDLIINIITLGSFLLIISYGQSLVVLLGGLDLSVPSTVMIGGILSSTFSSENTITEIIILIFICFSGFLIGLINGFGVSFLKIPPFIMTMGCNIIFASIALGSTGGSTLGGAPYLLNYIIRGNPLLLPNIVYLIIIFSLIAYFVQNKTLYGRYLYLSGSNIKSAIISGIPTHRVTIITYAISALVCSFCGCILTGYANGATLSMGELYLIPSISAVVIGGFAISGGVGSFLGLSTGVLFLTTLDSVISATSLSQGWRMIVSGMIILFAVILKK